MDESTQRLKKIADQTLPWIVLLILLIFTFAKFFRHPYGFSWEPDGRIYILFVHESEPTLKVGDQLVRVGNVNWNDFHTDLRKSFFEGVQRGQVVPVVVERSGQILTIPWVLPGVNQGEVYDQLFSEWFLGYAFWIIGTLVVLFLRPKDERWWLLAAFNFLTAIWLEAGGGTSNYHIWYSAILLRMTIWLCIPVYLHLHWVFPRPLGKLPPVLVSLAYAVAIALMIAQLYQILSPDLYFLGFLVAILGSIILLILHAVRQPASRSELRLIWIALLFALSPLIAVTVVGMINGSSRVDAFLLLSFPILPLSYLYTAYRSQLGGLEFRVNRLFSAYFFAILLGVLGLPLLALLDRMIGRMANTTLIVGAVAAAAALIASIWVFPIFQSLVERRWLGISLSSQDLPVIYSRRATTSMTMDALLGLLKTEVLPSLLIRQFLFIRVERASPEVLLAVGVDENNIKQDIKFIARIHQSERDVATGTSLRPAWARLVLPLKVGEELLGYWLFGRRDPDDVYLPNEIPVLQSLADQTAITLSNIIQTEQLRTVYQADIKRFEQERLRLALELHDSILNELVGLMMKIDERDLPPAFQAAYQQLIQHLRGIVKDLRPAFLTYGLKSALEELADNLMERSGDSIQVTVRVQSAEDRPSQEVEQHLFRIIQEACANALRHSKATEITISGNIDSRAAGLAVQDNGTGFDLQRQLDLNNLLADNHFGLAGMIERAKLIGAAVEIESIPQTGTCVTIRWQISNEQ